MQKTLIYLLSALLSSTLLQAQSTTEIITAIAKSQRSIRTVTYKTLRHDTLVTGDVRTITGLVKAESAPDDAVFGFRFWAKEDSVNSQLVFGGNMAWKTEDRDKTYSINTNSAKMKEILNQPGGRIVVPDLIRLDTSDATGFLIAQDKQFFYLTMSYADLTQHDVIKRFKKVTIDKASMLPVKVERHQETLGKVQHLSWNIQELKVNENVSDYDFAAPDFVKTHRLSIERLSEKHPLMALKGKAAPAFELKTFDGINVRSDEMYGKVMLLDFWEVWCGPCVESMPKVGQLYKKFKDKGLVVYGIVNDIKQLESAKRFISKKPEIGFPMLTGNDKLKRDFDINEIPEYVIIDKKGIVSYVCLGFSDEIETEIAKALAAD